MLVGVGANLLMLYGWCVPSAVTGGIIKVLQCALNGKEVVLRTHALHEPAVEKFITNRADHPTQIQGNIFLFQRFEESGKGEKAGCVDIIYRMSVEYDCA